MTNKHPTLREKLENGSPDADRQNTHWAREIVPDCDHEWQPVSMVFETQLLDDRGRVQVRQPAINNGRCYLVCLKCMGHTYVETGWVGYYLGSPDDLESEPGAGLSTENKE
jgi:hypothetical protein